MNQVPIGLYELKWYDAYPYLCEWGKRVKSRLYNSAVNVNATLNYVSVARGLVPVTEYQIGNLTRVTQQNCEYACAIEV